MYGLLWYFVCLGLLRYLFRWRWSWAFALAGPVTIGSLVLGIQLWEHFGTG